MSGEGLPSGSIQGLQLIGQTRPHWGGPPAPIQSWDQMLPSQSAPTDTPRCCSSSHLLPAPGARDADKKSHQVRPSVCVTEWQRHWQRMMKQKTTLSPRPASALMPREALIQLHAC